MALYKYSSFPFLSFLSWIAEHRFPCKLVIKRLLLLHVIVESDRHICCHNWWCWSNGQWNVRTIPWSCASWPKNRFVSSSSSSRTYWLTWHKLGKVASRTRKYVLVVYVSVFNDCFIGPDRAIVQVCVYDPAITFDVSLTAFWMQVRFLLTWFFSWHDILGYVYLHARKDWHSLQAFDNVDHVIGAAFGQQNPVAVLFGATQSNCIKGPIRAARCKASWLICWFPVVRWPNLALAFFVYLCIIV